MATVAMVSPHLYSAPQPLTKLMRMVHILVSWYTASKPWFTDWAKSAANSWLLKIFRLQPGGEHHNRNITTERNITTVHHNGTSRRYITTVHPNGTSPTEHPNGTSQRNITTEHHNVTGSDGQEPQSGVKAAALV